MEKKAKNFTDREALEFWSKKFKTISLNSIAKEEEKLEKALGIAKGISLIKVLYYTAHDGGIITRFPLDIIHYVTAEDIVGTLFLNAENYSYFRGHELECDYAENGEITDSRYGRPLLIISTLGNLFGVRISSLFFVDGHGELINVFDMRGFKFRYPSNEPKGSFFEEDPALKEYLLKKNE